MDGCASYSITLSARATNPRRNFETKLLRCLEVNDQLPVAFLKVRHLCGIPAVENFDDLRSDVSSSRPQVEGVGHQCSGVGRIAITADSGKSILLSQST